MQYAVVNAKLLIKGLALLIPSLAHTQKTSRIENDQYTETYLFNVFNYVIRIKGYFIFTTCIASTVIKLNYIGGLLYLF